jgi:hypothetical protein
MMIIATIYTMDATKRTPLLVLFTLLVKTSLLAAKTESLPSVYPLQGFRMVNYSIVYKFLPLFIIFLN